MNKQQVCDVISALNLDPIKVKLMHRESGEGWSLAKANQIEGEYRRFLHLMKMFPHEQTAPLFDVDIFWHYHILDTLKYATDCERVFGYFLHHFPYIGLRGEEDEEAHQRVGSRMRELYEATFGEAYIREEAARSGPGVTPQAPDAAPQTAWSGAVGNARPAQAAWSGAVGAADAAKTAWSGAVGVTDAAKTAWSGAVGVTDAGKTAWSGAVGVTEATKTAWSGAVGDALAARQAWPAAVGGAQASMAAWSGASPGSDRQPAAFYSVRPILAQAA